MKLIFCLDDKNGMMFFGKRQSQDRVLRAWLLDYTKGSRLWMSTYSAKQFAEGGEILSDDEYMRKAAKGDFCFIENKDYSCAEAEEILLCRWNRRYQADRFFEFDLEKNGFRKVASSDIVGSSHEKITIETYRRTVTE